MALRRQIDETYLDAVIFARSNEYWLSGNPFDGSYRPVMGASDHMKEFPALIEVPQGDIARCRGRGKNGMAVRAETQCSDAPALHKHPHESLVCAHIVDGDLARSEPHAHNINCGGLGQCCDCGRRRICGGNEFVECELVDAGSVSRQWQNKIKCAAPLTVFLRSIAASSPRCWTPEPCSHRSRGVECG